MQLLLWAEFLVMLYILVCLLVPPAWTPMVWFWRWLERRLLGSRESYYLGQDGLVSSPKILRYPEHRNRIPHHRPFGQIIEVSCGLFRKRSAIYGYTDHGWEIAKSWAVVGHWVSLTDVRGLPVKAALQTINRYSSLKLMVDDIENMRMELGLLRGQNEAFRTRCAEQDQQIKELFGEIEDLNTEHQKKIQRLKADLELAHYQRKQLIAAISAILSRLEKDRSRFKSSFSRALRVFLTELVREHITQVDKEYLPDPDPLLIQKWEENLDHRLTSVVS